LRWGLANRRSDHLATGLPDMRPTRRRLTNRDLMIAVVAFALSLKLGLAYSRSPAYWQEARFQGQMADAFRFYADRFEDGSAILVGEELGEQKTAAIRAREFAAKLDRERTKFLRAAFLPWLPDAPDPPST
jgi:hypothetical protein